MEFTASTMTYNSFKDLAIIATNLVDTSVCRFVAQEIRLMEQHVNLENPQLGKEKDFEESFSFYSPFCLETLSLHVQPKVEEYLQRKIYPSYTYGRIYRPGAKLTEHLDRRSSEYTLSVTIEDNDNILWPICVEHFDNTVTSAKLDVGDAIIYSGRDMVHWRPDSFTGAEVIQAFIQYVDADGDSVDLKWDGRPLLGMPFQTTNPNIDHNFDRKSDLADRLKQRP